MRYLFLGSFVGNYFVKKKQNVFFSEQRYFSKELCIRLLRVHHLFFPKERKRFSVALTPAVRGKKGSTKRNFGSQRPNVQLCTPTPTPTPPVVPWYWYHRGTSTTGVQGYQYHRGTKFSRAAPKENKAF